MTNAGDPIDELVIVHDRVAREFRVELGGQTAVLNYELSPGVMDITHTGVPEVFRRRGIAAKLTRAGLEFARAEGLAVVPSCPYVADYIRRTPEYAGLVRGE
jgi:predicted GNAT family acetyltransferase